MAAARSRVQCLDRALDILEALAQRRTLGVTALAGIVGLHVATTHNILSALQGRNYLLNDGGQYRLGPALAALAGRSNPLTLLPGLAQPRLDEITHRTGESSVAAVLSGTRVIMVAATASVDGFSCPVPGQAFPSALALATGRLLVAHRPEKEWPRHLGAYAAHAGGPADIAADDPAAWKEVFETIRETGRCIVTRGRDVGSVASPVRDAAGAVVAALGANSVGRFGDREHRDRLTGAVLTAARLVSEALGYSSNTGEH